MSKIFSGAQRTAQGKDFELILTFKMETRHPVGGPFSQEFLAFVIVAKSYDYLKSQDLGIFKAIFVFFKRPLMVKFSKLCSESLHGEPD